MDGITKIITHPGPAHYDDLVAVALLAFHYGPHIRVERRDPTHEELDNPSVFVVDVGGRLGPELRNFDHHHNLELPCAAHQVAEWLASKFPEVWEKAVKGLRKLTWWQFMDDMDRRGPFQTAKKYGYDPSLTGPMGPLGGPLSTFAVRYFQENPWATEFLFALGDEIHNLGLEMEEGLQRLKETTDAIDLDGRLVLLNEEEGISGAPGEALAAEVVETLSKEGYTPKVAVTVTPDNRGPGWMLFRWKDHPDVDFTRIEGDPRVLFAHKGGFIAKTYERIPVSEVLGLIKASTS
ncbi:hypothetical protein D6833_06680 [Candidatus Parcubacteria bacterium]|nr:MAG: hypothetical protein D6833_06680 [Candidatus Parcubacteria bacterium]